MANPHFCALIFDMDGVLVDSNPWHRAAWAEYTRRHGVDMTPSMQLRMYGKRNDEIVRDFLGGQLTDEEVFAHGAAKEALYREMIGPHAAVSLIPGVREFLERHRNMDMALATNAERANVDFILAATGLDSFFRVIVDGNQVTNAKPHPEIYLCVADMLGAAPVQCVVFEDSLAGVQAGIAAGMRVVGVTTTHDELPGVSLLISDFNDPALEPWLQEQLRTEKREIGM